MTEIDDGPVVHVGRPRPRRPHHRHPCRRAAGDGARATAILVQGGPLGPVVGFLTRGLTKRYLAMEAAGLKARAEAR